MKNKICLNVLLVLFYVVSFNLSLFASEKENIETKPKEEIKTKPEIKVIELTGFLIKLKYKSDLPEGKELSSWYVNTKLGVLVLIPVKDGDGEKYFNQYEGKEVIVRGIGEVSNEKNDKGEKVKSTKLSKFVSIELKKGLRIGDRKGCNKAGK